VIDISYKIAWIRKLKTITSYLGDLGIQPNRDYGDRKSYICPIPSHNDTNPSFFVYSSGIYENFCCYGCNEYGDLIQLYKAMNGLSTRSEAVDVLGDGFNPSENDELSLILQNLKQIDTENVKNAKNLPGKIALNLAYLCYNHLQNSNFNKDEYEFLEKIYKNLDYCIREGDIESLLSISEFLTSERIAIINNIAMTPLMYRSYIVGKKKSNLEMENAYKQIEVYDKMSG